MHSSTRSASQRPDERAALLFPGQGSPLRLADGLRKSHPVAQRTFEQAADVLGWPVTPLFQARSNGRPADPCKSQPALLALSVALARTLHHEQEVDAPRACLGHSLGEYAALVTAGVLDFDHALRLVAERARLMDEAIPAGTGGMAAVLAIDRAAVERVCAEVADGDMLVVANLNAPDQVVVSGHLRAIERAEPALRRAGARRIVRLQVASAFHTPLMQPAAERLAKLLAEVPVRPPRVPVLSNATGAPHPAEPDGIRRALAAQLVGPVRWEACMRWAIGRGVDVFVECAPGGVLCGLARRIDATVRAVCVDDHGALPVAERT